MKKTTLILFALLLPGKSAYSQLKFEKMYSSFHSESPVNIVSSFDGGYLKAASYSIPGTPGINYFHSLKIDSTGSTQWTHEYRIAGYMFYVKCVRQTSDSGFIFSFHNLILPLLL